jgi:branched-chain amino acid transport system substrate-binding protein
LLAVTLAASLLPLSSLATWAADSDSQTKAKTSTSHEPIRIGFVTSLSTGLAGRAAHELVDGIKLYFSSINNEVSGRPVEIIIEDDDGRIANAVAKVHKLVEKDHVDVLTGVVLTPIMYALTPLITSAHIPYVGCFSGADDVTQRKRSPWIMRTSYSNSQPVHPFGEYVAKKLHYKRIATVGMDYQYCWETVGGFQQTYEKAGGQIVQKLWAANGTEDFTDVVAKLRKDIDAVFIATSGKSAEYLPKYVRAANAKLPMLGSMTSFDEDVITKVGIPYDGAVGCSTYCATLDTPANKRFVAAYREKYNREPGWYAENGYTNGLWIATAIQALHGDVSNKDRFFNELRNARVHDAELLSNVVFDDLRRPPFSS